MKHERSFDLNNVTVTVDSVTYAIKLRKLLLRAGIQSKLVKISTTIEGQGCKNGLTLDESDFYSAVTIMKNAGISYSLYNVKNVLS